MSQFIVSVRIVFRPQAAASQKSPDPPVDTGSHPCYFSVAGRAYRPERHLASFIFHIDAVQSQRVKVNIEIQVIPKALDETDRAVPGLSLEIFIPCPAADRCKNGAHEYLQDGADQ
jgi:hypothetical protein